MSIKGIAYGYSVCLFVFVEVQILFRANLFAIFSFTRDFYTPLEDLRATSSKGLSLLAIYVSRQLYLLL